MTIEVTQLGLASNENTIERETIFLVNCVAPRPFGEYMEHNRIMNDISLAYGILLLNGALHNLADEYYWYAIFFFLAGVWSINVAIKRPPVQTKIRITKVHRRLFWLVFVFLLVVFNIFVLSRPN